MTDKTIRASSATVYGYPRQGDDRQLKRATEAYWAQRIGVDELEETARALRRSRMLELRDAGIDEIPSNEFSMYDHVLDTSIMLGAIPDRFRDVTSDPESTRGRADRYFAMARGTSDVEPLEMTKWFTTNYHYLVPELGVDSTFSLDATKPIGEFVEAREHDIVSRPVILGPISFLALAKTEAGTHPRFDVLDLLDRVLPCYVELLRLLRREGAEWVQIDEPVLVMDQPSHVLRSVSDVYGELCATPDRPKVLVASYFDRLGDALPVLASSPIEGIAMDLTGSGIANMRGLEELGGLLSKRLVAGVVDGHNVWATNLDAALNLLEALSAYAERIDVASSCSLVHVPLDTGLETGLDPEIVSWLAFARQKLGEITTLTRGLARGRASIAHELEESRELTIRRAQSSIVRVDAVRARSNAVRELHLRRTSSYPIRHDAQASRLQLPLLPTTTIGSFPQTSRLRRARAELARGTLDRAGYEVEMRDEIKGVIELQESIGLDVLVHGEPERNDMVQYFAEQLEGFVVTEHGWVQSYGSRYVRPPIIVGDVSRPRQMTVGWTSYAQSLTSHPVKGMLTGPVTMLAWSFVRNDQPRAETARQVALALRDEVLDLERAGVAVIQVDEPALRETLPLRRRDRGAYLHWAVESFALATAGVRDDTQIHTHMCYAEFGDVLDAITAMDADVISLEAARSHMAIVDDLARAEYPNEIGPGVWDIHSPRVPSIEEIEDRLKLAVTSFPAARVWANPDCGLKTRGYREVEATLKNLVAAVDRMRKTSSGR